MGHVSNITVKDEGVGAEYDWYRDLAFYYTTAGRLWRTVEDRWHENLQGEPVDYAKLSAKEFYYDDARARYLTRDVDPDTWATIGDWLWTDYGGMQPYGDFTTDANHAISEDKRYLSESGARVEQTVSTAATRYLHGDLIDSTMLATDQGGTAVSAVSYTAFGEPIGDASQLDTRYQYAGGWGYESDLLTLSGAPNTAPISLQHVGERWYQPNTGRFVQRDPTGMMGGLNLYGYCINNPLSAIDPTGTTSTGPAGWGPFPDPTRPGGIKGKIRYIDKLIARFLPETRSWDPVVRGMAKQRVRDLVNLRNYYYGKGFGFLSCVVLAGEIGAAAGRAVTPTVNRARGAYADWTLTGRGNRDLGDLLYY